jgi:hypothetical protein
MENILCRQNIKENHLLEINLCITMEPKNPELKVDMEANKKQ